MNSPARSKTMSVYQVGLSFKPRSHNDPFKQPEKDADSCEINNRDGGVNCIQTPTQLNAKYASDSLEKTFEDWREGHGSLVDGTASTSYYDSCFYNDYTEDLQWDDCSYDTSWVSLASSDPESFENLYFGQFGSMPDWGGLGNSFDPLNFSANLNNFSLLPDQQNPDGSPSLLGQNSMSFVSPLTNPFGGGLLTGAFSSATNPPAQASNAPQFESSEPQATEPPKPVAVAPIPNPFQMSA